MKINTNIVAGGRFITSLLDDMMVLPVQEVKGRLKAEG